MKTTAITLLMLLAMLVAWPTRSQAEEPASEPASKPAAASADDDARKIAELLDKMSPEDVERAVKAAMTALREEERKMVTAEIEAGLLYEPGKVKEAIAIIRDKGKDNSQDNVERICKAFAVVDGKFGNAYKLCHSGKAMEAVGALKMMVNAQEQTYLSAAKYFTLADALAAAGQCEDASQAYGQVSELMKERVSFAAAAGLKTGEMWEKANRSLYAQEAYADYLKRYGLLMDPADRERLQQKVDAITALYKDPMATLAGKMGDVKTMLSKVQSGKTTQDKQAEIIVMIDDLIKTAEEKDQGGGQGQPKPKPGEDKKGDAKDGDKKPGEGEGKEGKEGDAKDGNKTSKSKPPKNPSKGAQVSALRDLAMDRGNATEDVRAKGDDWGDMPPERRKEIEAIREKMMSEKYRAQVAEYYKRISEADHSAANGK